MARGTPWHGEVVSIHIAPKAEDPMKSLKAVRAIPGKGLEGDRYFRASGTYSDRPGPGREITLIESEAIEAMARDNELAIAPGEARRNVVTRGASLSAGPQSRAPNADAPDRDRAGGVRALEGAAAGRGVRARPRRMRWPLVHPDPSEGGVGPGQDFSDPEVDTEPDRAEAPGLVPREPRAARACPPPADTARIPLRLHD